MPIAERLSRIWRSTRALPLWVQLWVVLLIAVNTAAFFMTGTPTGQWTAIAWVFVMIANTVIPWASAGITRAMSLPHVIWLPLVGWLVWRLWLGGAPAPMGTEATYALIVIVVNGISLAFDAVDSWKWLKGEREVVGATGAGSGS